MDRLPPHSLDAEQGVIGACLLDASQCVTAAVEQGVSSLAFYDLRCRELWDNLLAMVEARHPADLVTVQGRLRDANKLEACGGITFLLACQDACPSPSSLAYFTSQVLERATLRRTIEVAGQLVADAYSCQGSPDALLDRAEAAVLAIRSARATSDRVTDMPSLVQNVIATLERRASGGVTGLPTGFSSIDRLIGGGLQPSEMFLVAGRPSAGKTAWSMNVVENVAVRWLADWDAHHPGDPYVGERVGVFSLEMTAEALTERLIASLALHSTRSLAYLSPAEYNRLTIAAGTASRLPVVLDDTPSLTIDAIRARARRMHRQSNVRLLVVDYAQLIEGGDEREENARLAKISKGLKSLAKELSVPVLVVAQLNRDSEREAKRKPRMSDLRGSGQFEQDADVISMLYLRDPEGAEALAPEEPREVLFRLAKQRNGVRDWDVPLMFSPAWTRFQEKSPVEH